MIEPGRIGDAKLGAQKSGSKFGHNFLKTIGFIAEALTMLAVEAMGRPCPMNKLMASGALICIGRRGGGCANEQVARRHLDEVARTVEGARAVERPAAAFAEFCAGRGDEGVHMRQPRGQIGTRRRRFALIILDLIDVEDPGGPGVEALGAVFVRFVRVGASVFGVHSPYLTMRDPLSPLRTWQPAPGIA